MSRRSLQCLPRSRVLLHPALPWWVRSSAQRRISANYTQVPSSVTPTLHHSLLLNPLRQTRYHLHPAKWLHRIPDSVTFEEGSLLEPLCVALAGIERSGLKLGDPLLIASVLSPPRSQPELTDLCSAVLVPSVLSPFSPPMLQAQLRWSSPTSVPPASSSPSLSSLPSNPS